MDSGRERRHFVCGCPRGHLTPVPCDGTLACLHLRGTLRSHLPGPGELPAGTVAKAGPLGSGSRHVLSVSRCLGRSGCQSPLAAWKNEEHSRPTPLGSRQTQGLPSPSLRLLIVQGPPLGPPPAAWGHLHLALLPAARPLWPPPSRQGLPPAQPSPPRPPFVPPSQFQEDQFGLVRSSGSLRIPLGSLDRWPAELGGVPGPRQPLPALLAPRVWLPGARAHRGGNARLDARPRWHGHHAGLLAGLCPQPSGCPRPPAGLSASSAAPGLCGKRLQGGPGRVLSSPTRTEHLPLPSLAVGRTASCLSFPFCRQGEQSTWYPGSGEGDPHAAG